MDEPFIPHGADPSNPDTHVIIEVRGKHYSVFVGAEQDTANSIRDVLDA